MNAKQNRLRLVNASEVELSMHQERLMMSAIQPSVAALEAELMEQEQHDRCSVVLP